MGKHYVAIDLGASSGRVILGSFGAERLNLQVVHRFPNPIQKVAGRLRWNTRLIFKEIKAGLKKIGSLDLVVASLGVDTWGVDYGLFDDAGQLLEEPVCYRDQRTDGIMDEVLELVSREDIFKKTGIQFLPINTLYQIVAQRKLGEWPEQAAKLLMMPDIFHYYLCGEMVGEYTIATTTQLFNAKERLWDQELFSRLELPIEIMPKLAQPGQAVGTLEPSLQSELGLPPIKITLPATHDTGSAVIGTPLSAGWGYVSSGTWSLVGIETEDPILTARAAPHNFTNEGGAYGTTRFLKNVMGLWILESCRREWAEHGTVLSYGDLMPAMAATPTFQGFIYTDDLQFLNPASMLNQVLAYLKETGQKSVNDQVGLSKTILESLAMRYASVFQEVEMLTGEPLLGVHIVGGGSQNEFLNQATANATGLPVLAGPVESTAIGNLIVQAIADGRFKDLDGARSYVRQSIPVKSYLPQDVESWEREFERYKELEG